MFDILMPMMELYDTQKIGLWSPSFFSKGLNIIFTQMFLGSQAWGKIAHKIPVKILVARKLNDQVAWSVKKVYKHVCRLELFVVWCLIKYKLSIANCMVVKLSFISTNTNST